MIPRAIVVGIVVVGCGPRGDVPAQTQAVTSRDAATPTVTSRDAATLSLRWRPHAIAAAGLSIDMVDRDGLEIYDSELDGIHVVSQFSRPIAISVWFGAEMSLARWRDGFRPNSMMGRETAVSVCGRPARRQEGTVAATSATGIFPKVNGGWEERRSDHPSAVHVAIASTNAAGVGFVVGWVVEADQRDAMRADEDHFFASIACR